MKLYNSLTRKLEKFKPLNPPRVRMYTCGPTVYDYATIGNWRTYVLGDVLFRTLKFVGFKIDYIMNITDVGHLTGDNLGDADIGEDRLARAARRERKTAWQIADFYTKEFLQEFDKLNLTRPRLFTKATDHIKEQIELVKRIEKGGFTYKTSDGLYFDVAAYEKAGNTYGELSSLDRIQEGARVKINPEKKDPRDFALWKFSIQDEKRDMEWDSPWGRGFPGWHIECSAMGIKYLGEQFDIHVGGEDLRSTHHPNEIAQAEAATSRKPFVKYWVHGAFLLVDGGRMGKSLGNAYTLKDIEERGFSSFDLRYFYLTGHYRKQLNFTWEGLKAAKNARVRLLNLLCKFASNNKHILAKLSKSGKKYKDKFKAVVCDDLNMPEALAVVWEVVGSSLADDQKYKLLIEFDRVLGLAPSKALTFKLKAENLPIEIQNLIKERKKLRKQKKWKEADKIREQIRQKGYIIEDTPRGTTTLARLD